ncbi:MAG: hypothetical protein PWQ06_2508 [Anaerophaga sp.]|nr:hypothetical protein [Anaerophaga sp.]
MRKILSVIVVLFVFSSILFSKSVDSTEIVSVVEGFIDLNYDGVESFSVKSIESLKDDEKSFIVLVRLNPEGWVLISADDVAEPVLGFSFESDFDRAYFEKNEGLQYVVSGYDNQIETLKRERDERNPEWDRLKKKQQLKSEAPSVSPLIKVEWNQDSGWNSSAPADPNGPGGHAYVGCVAVSMGQAMTVFQYPDAPEGKKSYSHVDYGTLSVNYDAYGEYNWSNMITSSPNSDISDLLYHCAVAVEMDFGSDGSGSITSKTVYALRNYFTYAPTVRSLVRVENTQDWIDILNEELLAGRPLIYSGDANDGRAGHAFNIDGVSSNGFYHLNWGWSGINNGYFNIDNLAPGSDDFTKNQSAIVGIRPPIAKPTDISLSKTEIMEGMPEGSTVGEIIVESEVDDNEYTFEVKGKMNIFGEYAPADFYEEESLLKTKKSFEFIDGETNEKFVNITVRDQNRNELSKNFYIKILEDTSDDVSINEISAAENVYYDAQNHYVEFESVVPSGRDVEIFDLSGKKLLERELYGNRLNVSHLQRGVFVLIYQEEVLGKYYYFKFIKN